MIMVAHLCYLFQHPEHILTFTSKRERRIMRLLFVRLGRTDLLRRTLTGRSGYARSLPCR